MCFYNTEIFSDAHLDKSEEQTCEKDIVSTSSYLQSESKDTSEG